MKLRKLARGAFGCFTLAGILGAWASIGCGGLGPGDYVIYEVAFSEPDLSGDCKGDPKDSNSFRSSGTLVLYAGPNDKFYLDAGQATLEGTTTDNGFRFTGQSVDVEDQGPSPGERTHTIKTTITITADGAAISGTVSTSDDSTWSGCSAAGCPDDTTCNTTTKFVGSRVDNVALEHDPF